MEVGEVSGRGRATIAFGSYERVNVSRWISFLRKRDSVYGYSGQLSARGLKQRRRGDGLSGQRAALCGAHVLPVLFDWLPPRELLSFFIQAVDGL